MAGTGGRFEGLLAVPLNADKLRPYVTLATTKIGLLPPAELSEEQAAQVLAATGKKNGHVKGP